MIDGKALVAAVKKEVIEPGIESLMNTQYFTELRQGKLSIKRMQGWAIQHYLHNKAILKSFALGMVKNAHEPTLFDYFTEWFATVILAAMPFLGLLALAYWRNAREVWSSGWHKRL